MIKLIMALKTEAERKIYEELHARQKKLMAVSTSVRPQTRGVEETQIQELGGVTGRRILVKYTPGEGGKAVYGRGRVLLSDSEVYVIPGESHISPSISIDTLAVIARGTPLLKQAQTAIETDRARRNQKLVTARKR
jgi:hypothetical protein